MAHIQKIETVSPESARALVVMRGLALVLSLAALAMAWFWITRSNSDFGVFLLPWYQAILAEGRLAALHGGFSDYTPPYIYVLVLCTLTDGWLSPIVAVKLCSMLWTLFGATQVHGICRAVGRSREFSLLAAVIFATLPEISLNSIVWGQSDVIYVSFLLAFLHALLRGRRGWAMVMFGIALAFKPLAAVVAPFVAYLLLRDLPVPGRALRALRDAMLVPLTYAAMMLPAVLAGRPLRELFTFYASQYGEHPLLSMAAPNPWLIVQQLVAYPADFREPPLLSRLAPDTFLWLQAVLPQHDGMILAGVALALLACGALLLSFLTCRGRPGAAQLVTMLALAALLVPYFAPRMHERYFIAAGVLTYVLALLRPGLWPAALCMQAAAVLTYTRFLFDIPKLPILGVFLATAALLLLLRRHLRDRKEMAAAAPARPERLDQDRRTPQAQIS
ncbi:Mannosyltransferase family protein [Roseomonas mucosa]|uniref:Mannosyltransferase family protein n=1 Tax=Roseomonas mucosa TaxID=207340 RepID=A0A4Y1N1S2_9PROT|nr:glycosyltransferase 87 family protein [Roseomonas mucosa]AWV24000.1 Mannosyltransferase family protein [Roseomonas mucosa]MDT8275563.1 glycosyltransferase 87 family protein [Roseomonas mucosa]MDT8354517.1 glycosyltransferase 87 family protein [Roseomonas mucosa]MDU7522203.1 glycosyltransferase 87 family protein [Roseomonas mucosa]